jgi:phage recombination protein Bet
MAKTTVKEKPAEQEKIADQPTNQGAVAVFHPPRLAYAPALEERYGVDKGQWKVLVEAIYPSAKTEEAVVMALAYCKQRKLDLFKRPVHIVPMWDSKKGAYVETIWPSISELRTTASRTKNYAGIEEAIFGPTLTRKFIGETYVNRQLREVEIEVEFPEWCRMTVHRIVGNIRCAFVGPKVLWIESYATIGKTDLPNNMWQERTVGQIEKCAEAAALRRAFPEEIGNEYAAEEMEGRKIPAGIEVVTTASKRDDGPPKRVDAAKATETTKDPAKEEVTEGEFTETDGTKHDADGVVQEDDGGNTSMDDPEPDKPIACVVDFAGMNFAQATAAYIAALETSKTTKDVMEFATLNRTSLDKIFGRYEKGAAEIRRAAENMLTKLRPKNVENAGKKKDDPISSGPQKKDDGPPKRKPPVGTTTAGTKAPVVDPEAVLKEIKRIIDGVTDPNELDGVWRDYCEPLMEDLSFPGDKTAAQQLHKEAENRLGID